MSHAETPLVYQELLAQASDEDLRAAIDGSRGYTLGSIPQLLADTDCDGCQYTRIYLVLSELERRRNVDMFQGAGLNPPDWESWKAEVELQFAIRNQVYAVKETGSFRNSFLAGRTPREAFTRYSVSLRI